MDPAQKERIVELLDAVKQIIGPLDAAFDAFSDIADTVGMELVPEILRDQVAALKDAGSQQADELNRVEDLIAELREILNSAA